MENRTAKKKFPAAAVAAIVAAVIVVILAAAYCGLCSWVRGNGRLLPGTMGRDIAGSAAVDLGGLTRDEAVARLEAHAEDCRGQSVLTIYYGDGKSASLSGDLLERDPAASVDYAMAVKDAQPFLKLGALWLGLAHNPATVSLTGSVFTPEGEAEAEQLISRIADELYVAPVDFDCQLDEELGTVTVTPGVDGEELDQAALLEAVKLALVAGETELQAETVAAPTAPLNGQALYERIYREPQVPQLQADGSLTLPVQGISVDVAEAQQLLDGMQPGQPCEIPIILTQPDFSACEDLLYQDLLANCVSYMDGVANRSFNVNRTAEFCNGTVLLPGEVFSYLGTIGNPSVANGYKLSTGYQGGKTVEMEGGGACQVSSSLYYCAVYANLEIVNRANHAFSVGYLPNGLDATVYYPSLDYQFRNNTPYPIKIVAYTDGRAAGKVTVQIYGTKTDDTYVIPERYTLSSTPWETVYKPDPEIPQGTTKVDVTPYTGYVVEVYRCVYDGNGNLISRTFENKSTYAKRDKVILFNPADAASLGLNPDGTPLTGPAPSPSPEPTPEPTPAPSPEPTPYPEPTPSPEPIPGEGEIGA